MPKIKFKDWKYYREFIQISQLGAKAGVLGRAELTECDGECVIHIRPDEQGCWNSGVWWSECDSRLHWFFTNLHDLLDRYQPRRVTTTRIGDYTANMIEMSEDTRKYVPVSEWDGCPYEDEDEDGED